jgi:hypothetical protein
MRFMLAFALIVSIAAGPAYADAPAFVTYSSRLGDGTGWGQSDSLDLLFRLYGCECAFDGGCSSPCPEGQDTALWSGLHLNVLVVDGYFTVNLGMCSEIGFCDPNPANAGFPTALPEQAWLGVVLNGQEMPRQPIGSVPYAVEATRASANGVPVGMIGIFSGQCPPGWVWESDLNGYSIRGGSESDIDLPVGKANDSGTGSTNSKNTGNAKWGSSNYASGDDVCKYCDEGRFISFFCAGNAQNTSCSAHNHSVSSLNVSVTVVPKHRKVIFCRYVGGD